jgi:hypothetical protein
VLRSQIPATERQRAAEQAATYLIQQPYFHASQHIACYYAVQDELDPYQTNMAAK